MTAGPPAEHLSIMVYATHDCLRGLVELRGAIRLIDLLNQSAVPVIAMLDGEVVSAGSTEWPGERRPLVVNKAEALFIHPTTDYEPPVAATGQRIASFRVEVGVRLGEYEVQGTLHLPDIVPLAQYLAALRDRFLPLTQATVCRASDGQVLATASYVVVNRDRLTALYEL